jgi:hypothetical protein
MGVGKLSAQRLRAKYARVFAAIPLPVRSHAGLDPGELALAAAADVDGRDVRFEAHGSGTAGYLAEDTAGAESKTARRAQVRECEG